MQQPDDSAAHPGVPGEHSPDVTTVLLAYRGRMAAAAPADLELAVRVAGQLTPPNWALEWRLPVWVGAAFGVDRELLDDLVLGNVLGLVAIRLFDDLADGDVPEADRQAAVRIASAAYEAALAIYRQRFDPGSRMWPFLDRTMATWRRSSTGGPGRRLEARGAPLKIPAFALCLAAAHKSAPATAKRWRPLERCIDAALSALVGYDQFLDWQPDLASGRWNAFVAGITPHRQTTANRDRNRTLVVAAMLGRPVIREHFRRVARDAMVAAELAAGIGIEALAHHLAGYAATTTIQGDEIAKRFEGAGARGSAVLLGQASPHVATLASATTR